MSDGGDWTTYDEEEEVSDPNVTSVRSPKNAAASALVGKLAIMIIGFAALMIAVIGFVILWAAEQPQQNQEVVPTQAQRVDTKLVGGKSKEAPNIETIEDLKRQLMQAAWGDFDTAKRDKLAQRLVDQTDNHRITEPEITLHLAGAWDVLMDLPPPHNATWFDVHIRRGAWDRLLAMDSPSANTRKGTRALCLAGDEANALRVYQAQFKSALESPDAIACGLNDQTELGPFRGMSIPYGSAGLAASRNATDILELYRRSNEDRKNHHSDRRDLGAVLYVAGKISDKDMAMHSVRSGPHCDGLPRGREGLAESVPPAVLFGAADKLAATDFTNVTRDSAVENLRVAAVLAGHLRHEDLRKHFEVTTLKNEYCLAQVEYEFEPEAALKRLTRLEKTRPDDPDLQVMLAMASARIGDFEAAFSHTQKAQKTAQIDTKTQKSADWMAIAFAHRLGRFDEFKLINQKEEETAFLQAINGTEAQQSDFRIQTKTLPMQIPLAVRFYLRGAIAPRHEEAYSDGLVDPNSSVSYYLQARAEAANWRGDVDSAKKWTDQRDALHLRAADGRFGGHHLLWTQ